MILIKDIFWERANLHLIFSESLKGRNVYLVNNDNLIKYTSIDDELVISVTNSPEGQMLDKGKWRIIATEEEFNNYEDYLSNQKKIKPENKICISKELIKLLDDKSRIFKYRKVYAYLISFSIDSKYYFFIHSNFMIENRKWKKFYLLAEKEGVKKKFKIIQKKIYLSFIKAYYNFMRLFKMNKKKNVLFLTENSDVLTGNLKLLYDSVEEEICNKKCYAINKFIKKNKTTSKKVYMVLKSIYMIAMSDVIFIDNYVPKLTHIKISKKTKIVQLWHAGVGFKSVGYARFGLVGSPHPYWSCHRRNTDVVVDHSSLIDIYKEVFGVKTEIFKSLGMPRLEGYLTKEKISAVTKELFSINADLKTKKVILFSPTFRGKGSSDAHYDYSKISLEKIHDFCIKNDFVFIIKMHPFVKKGIKIPSKYSDCIFDYSKLEINDLIYISDIMITDYSSCAYEYSLFNRPLVFYRFDKELYEYLRPMHSLKAFSEQQYEVQTFDELMNVLEDLKDIDIKNRFKDVKKRNNNNICQRIIEEYVGK